MEASPFPPPGPETDRLLEAGIEFVMREWWVRLWVVQEVLLAREVEFCFGGWLFTELDVWIGMLGFLVLLGRRNYNVSISTCWAGTDSGMSRDLDAVSSRLTMISHLSEQRKSMINCGRGVCWVDE